MSETPVFVYIYTRAVHAYSADLSIDTILTQEQKSSTPFNTFVMQQSDNKASIMVLIPCYQEANNIGLIAGACVRLGYTTIVIDDGSTDGTADRARAAKATVLRQEKNEGKGAAVAVGLRYALNAECNAAVLLDGDGQHLPSEIKRFVDAYRASHADCIVGNRMSDTANMPFVRRQTNRFLSWLLSKQMGQRISDTQCGFRLIARRAIPDALLCLSSGFSADSKMLLQLAQYGYAIAEVPISTIYGDEKSKIRPVRDTLRFIRMLSKFRRQRRAWTSAGKSDNIHR